MNRRYIYITIAFSLGIILLGTCQSVHAQIPVKVVKSVIGSGFVTASKAIEPAEVNSKLLGSVGMTLGQPLIGVNTVSTNDLNGIASVGFWHDGLRLVPSNQSLLPSGVNPSNPINIVSNYPNPADNSIVLGIDIRKLQQFNPLILKIYTINGELKSQQQHPNIRFGVNEILVNTEVLQTGTYIVVASVGALHTGKRINVLRR